MKHLMISREFPPAPSGGIGTYAATIAPLLAARSEIVHVITQKWRGAEADREERCGGRLVVHRLPFAGWTPSALRRPRSLLRSEEARALFESDFPAQSFGWQACSLAEGLMESDGGIDVIEAPEFEAPAYFLQIRRALGLGPVRQPPIVIHLHSPTELIARHNDWPSGLPEVVTAERLEEYSIAAADALMCPSAFLARQAEQRYGLKSDAIEVIRYPSGDEPIVERTPKVWERGSICYVGRLEKRKGVLEWIEAAVAVANQTPGLHFELVGSNALGATPELGHRMLLHRIPAAMRERFRLRGHVPRSTLPDVLAGARIAVVPSRWDNLPYACLEAMRSGLPALVTNEGGMAEIVEDGRSGWIARSASPEELASALRRALSTPPALLAEMGAEAARRVRRLCDDGEVVTRHIELKQRLRSMGAVRSVKVPENLPGSDGRRAFSPSGSRACADKGLAVVVTAGSYQSATETLTSLHGQSRSAAAVVVVRPACGGGEASEPVDAGVLEARSPWSDRASMANCGVAAIQAAGIRPLGYLFLDARDRLSPACLGRYEQVLDHCEDVGLVSPWVRWRDRHRQELTTPPSPSFPYQLLENQAAAASAIRAEAWQDIGGFRPPLTDGFESWDLVNAVLAIGWKGVTVPEVLCERATRRSHDGDRSTLSPETMRRLVLQRFPALVVRDAERLLLMSGSDPARKGRQATRVLEGHVSSMRLAALEAAEGADWPLRVKQMAVAGFYGGLSRMLRWVS